MMSVDQRGFKTFIQTEAAAFLKPSQVMVNATVKKINHSASGATVTLADGSSLTADYVLSTFSLGVLHNDDVIFDPPLPSWKQEALHSMSMVRNLFDVTRGLSCRFRQPTQRSSFSFNRSSGLALRYPSVVLSCGFTQAS